MYRPNFCAECGTRVERKRRRAWTSGRFFCAACQKRFGRKRLVFPVALCACLLALGFALGRFVRHTPAPVIVERRLSADVRAARTESDGRTEGGAAETARSYGPDGTDGERPTDPLEAVSICGARTKKGTPCSRRVRGTGRCWQHRGRPAILPQNKLILP